MQAVETIGLVVGAGIAEEEVGSYRSLQIVAQSYVQTGSLRRSSCLA